jgi:thiol-disulfide isomerase/thioredoxin
MTSVGGASHGREEDSIRAFRYIVPAVAVLVLGGLVGQGFLHRQDYRVTAGASRDSAKAYTDGRPNLVAATFYSAWCSSCAVLDPKLRKVAPTFAGRAVEFVKFDFSMGQPEALTDKARSLGVEDVYLANKGATGFMALIDRRNQQVVHLITLRESEDQIRADIEAAIEAVSLQNEGEAGRTG